MNSLTRAYLLSNSDFMFIPVRPPMCGTYHLRNSRKFVRDIDKLPSRMNSIPPSSQHTPFSSYVNSERGTNNAYHEIIFTFAAEAL
jgi:hypothetical protein